MTPALRPGCEILVGGRAVPLTAPVLTWHTTGAEFVGLATRRATRAVLVHWTGGEREGPELVQAIAERTNDDGHRMGLSVQFSIGYDGTIWQHCDANAWAMHAGAANGWSCGIEVVNRANGKQSDKRPRVAYVDRVHGRGFTCSRFTDAQLTSLEVLVRALCRLWGLPYTVPEADTALSARELAGYCGVLGHYHVTERKIDPGTDVWPRIGLRRAP